MSELLKIGKALYKADYKTKTYWFYGRNLDKISKEEEENNKRKINGFVRVLRDGRRKNFRYKNES